MEFHILGALDVTHDGRPVALGGGRQRALLALLVLERNTPVSGDRIVEELWNGNAPATAPKVVQNLVSQLRRALGPEDVLRTRGHAYALAVPDDALDAALFERRVDEGRHALAAGDADGAAGCSARRSRCGAGRRSGSEARRAALELTASVASQPGADGGGDRP
jgi:DNA-binding SARP family transcriptional activator